MRNDWDNTVSYGFIDCKKYVVCLSILENYMKEQILTNYNVQQIQNKLQRYSNYVHH